MFSPDFSAILGLNPDLDIATYEEYLRHKNPIDNFKQILFEISNAFKDLFISLTLIEPSALEINPTNFKFIKSSFLHIINVERKLQLVIENLYLHQYNQALLDLLEENVKAEEDMISNLVTTLHKMKFDLNTVIDSAKIKIHKYHKARPYSLNILGYASRIRNHNFAPIDADPQQENPLVPLEPPYPDELVMRMSELTGSRQITTNFVASFSLEVDDEPTPENFQPLSQHFLPVDPAPIPYQEKAPTVIHQHHIHHDEDEDDDGGDDIFLNPDLI